jgi:hypothetical protein
LTTDAELVSPSDDEVRAYAARVPTDTSDDSDESALYFDGAPWVGRTLDGDALACGVRFSRGPVAFVAATQLPVGLRELESRFTDEQYLAKLCELAAVDRVATGGDSMSDMTGLAARMQAGMLMFSGRGGLQSQSGGRFDALFARLAYAAACSFGWTRCGAHLLARANRMAPLHDERGAQVVAVELFAGLARASRRWPTAERAPAREQLTAFLHQHCLGFSSGDGLDLGVEIAAALRFVANRIDARRVAWLADALHLEWLGDSVHAPAVGNASVQARALDLASTLVHMLGWHGASWCARIAAILQRGIDSQALLRFSQVRVSTGRLVAVTPRRGRAASSCGALSSAPPRSWRRSSCCSSSRSPTRCSRRRLSTSCRASCRRCSKGSATTTQSALMARHTAALLVQYGMSAAHVDALLGTLRTLVVTSVVAVAPRRAADAAAARVSQPLCAAVHRRVGARDCARGTARRAHRGARKRQRPDCLGAARPGAVARRRAASRRISSHRRARKTPLGSTPVCSSEPYNVPTWLLDVAQALAQHSSASSRVCRDAARRAASEFFRTRGRAIDELGVTRPSCSQLVRVAAQLRELSTTQTHYA